MNNTLKTFCGLGSLCDEAAVWVAIPSFLLLTAVLTNSHISGQCFSNLAASKKTPLRRAAGFLGGAGESLLPSRDRFTIAGLHFLYNCKLCKHYHCNWNRVFFLIPCSWSECAASSPDGPGSSREAGRRVPCPLRICRCSANRGATAADGVKCVVHVQGGVCWMQLVSAASASWMSEKETNGNNNGSQ